MGGWSYADRAWWTWKLLAKLERSRKRANKSKFRITIGCLLSKFLCLTRQKVLWGERWRQKWHQMGTLPDGLSATSGLHCLIPPYVSSAEDSGQHLSEPYGCQTTNWLMEELSSEAAKLFWNWNPGRALHLHRKVGLSKIYEDEREERGKENEESMNEWIFNLYLEHGNERSWTRKKAPRKTRVHQTVMWQTFFFSIMQSEDFSAFMLCSGYRVLFVLRLALLA